MDEHGITWLERAPKIKLLTVRDARKAYPPSRGEQAVFFQVARLLGQDGSLQGQHRLP
jgi:hypothetical protein